MTLQRNFASHSRSGANLSGCFLFMAGKVRSQWQKMIRNVFFYWLRYCPAMNRKMSHDVRISIRVTTYLLSIERADWPKLHDMFKARDANIWQREFPVGFPFEVSALNSIFINIFHDAVARIESRCVIKAKHFLLVCWFVRFCTGKLHSLWKARAIFPA